MSALVQEAAVFSLEAVSVEVSLGLSGFFSLSFELPLPPLSAELFLLSVL